MRRPKSIVAFERLIWAGFAVGAIGFFVAAHEIIPPQADLDVSFLIMMWVISLATTGGFWFAIARRGSNIARWFYAGFMALSLMGTMLMFEYPARAIHAGEYISVMSTALYLLAAIILLRSDAIRWLKGEREPDPSIFE